MGGCYSYDYGSSRCSTPARQKWETILGSALKSKDRAKLAEAYNEFFSSAESGFFKEIASLQGIKDIAKIPKEFPEIEYEVKFDMQLEGKGNEPSMKTLLDTFDFPAAKNARFLKDPVHNIAQGINRFYGTDSEERLVVITKGKGIYLKEKSEALPLDVKVPFQEIVIKRTENRYESDVDEVMNKIADIQAENGVSYRGRIRKEKGDDFILDTNDGRIYSFTITRAHLIRAGEENESAIQRQLEIEYGGYIPGFSGFEKDSEKDIVSGMVELARYTYALYGSTPIGKWRMSLAPTSERKYDFVAGTKALKSSNGRLKKSKTPLLETVLV